jgi:hypothetical protein
MSDVTARGYRERERGGGGGWRERSRSNAEPNIGGKNITLGEKLHCK